MCIGISVVFYVTTFVNKAHLLKKYEKLKAFFKILWGRAIVFFFLSIQSVDAEIQ